MTFISRLCLHVSIAVFLCIGTVSSGVQANAADDHPAAPASEATTAPLQSGSSTFNTRVLVEHIITWRDALAKQAAFQDWKHATYAIYPVGPGLHSWLVLLSNHDQEVGYMIISATEDQTFVLSEYGSGTHPLFSLNTLYDSLVQHGLIPSSIAQSQLFTVSSLKLSRLYIHPMLAVWKVEAAGKPIQYVHAKTGELLLADEQAIQAEAARLSRMMPTIPPATLPEQATTTIAPFDPYEHIYWLKDKPLSIQHVSDLILALQHKSEVTYVSNWMQQSYLVPLSLSGFQQWNNITYLQLEEVGTRWIPFDMLNPFGAFYER